LSEVNNDQSIDTSDTKDLVQRRSNRPRNIPTYLKDYQTDLALVKTTKYPI